MTANLIVCPVSPTKLVSDRYESVCLFCVHLKGKSRNLPYYQNMTTKKVTWRHPATHAGKSNSSDGFDKAWSETPFAQSESASSNMSPPSRHPDEATSDAVALF